MNRDYRLYLGAFCMLVSLFYFQAHACHAAAPPAEYAVWDRMPFEGAVEAKLEATAPITLYNAPRGTVPVGSISAGEIVQRISSVVYTHPQKHPVRVLRMLQSYKKHNDGRTPNGPTLQPGSYVYLLMYTGEGTYLGWYNGEEAWWLAGYDIRNFADREPRQPWGEYVGEMTSRNLSVEAWYCLRKSDGTTGWTKASQDGNFDNETLKTHWR